MLMDTPTRPLEPMENFDPASQVKQITFNLFSVPTTITVEIETFPELTEKAFRKLRWRRESE